MTDPKPVPRHDCKTEDRKLPIDRPCSACSAGDYEMEHHSHCPPFREDGPVTQLGTCAKYSTRHHRRDACGGSGCINWKPVVPDLPSQPGQRQDERAEFERYFLGNWCNYLNPFWRYPQSGDYVDQFVRGHYTTWQRARSSPPESTGPIGYEQAKGWLLEYCPICSQNSVPSRAQGEAFFSCINCAAKLSLVVAALAPLEAPERKLWIAAINAELGQLREWANRELQRAEAAESKVSALEGRLRLKEGAIKAQAEREDDAGERCGVDYEKAGCDWPDAVGGTSQGS